MYITDEHRNAIPLSDGKKDRSKGTIKELSQFDNKKPQELESEFEHFDVDNSHPTSLTLFSMGYYCLTKISIRAKRSISRVFSLFIVPCPFFVHCPYLLFINRVCFSYSKILRPRS